jgi:cell division protein FtsW (lipid II flippase)
MKQEIILTCIIFLMSQFSEYYKQNEQDANKFAELFTHFYFVALGITLIACSIVLFGLLFYFNLPQTTFVANSVLLAGGIFFAHTSFNKVLQLNKY